jgi:hypothetical protein
MKLLQNLIKSSLIVAFLASCASTEIDALKTFIIGDAIEYAEAQELVRNSEKTTNDLASRPFFKSLPKRATPEEIVNYYLLKYQSVSVTYDIIGSQGEVIKDAIFEIRGEVFLRTIRDNKVSITASMPVLEYLFISTSELEDMEEINIEFRNSDDYLISPFSTKYRYGENNNDGFAFELHDFSSTGGGLVTTRSRVDFTYDNEDNKLIGWQFTYWTKTEQTGGTELVNRTIEIKFDWNLRDN